MDLHKIFEADFVDTKNRSLSKILIFKKMKQKSTTESWDITKRNLENEIDKVIPNTDLEEIVTKTGKARQK